MRGDEGSGSVRSGLGQTEMSLTWAIPTKMLGRRASAGLKCRLTTFQSVLNELI
jgi:hypothetical protein